MTEKHGNLSIDSDNLFPIIKNGYIQIMIFSIVSLFLTDVMPSLN